MIDHARRFIFVHVPKTAGVSVSKALGGEDQLGHDPVTVYGEHRGAYFSFAFVRNPWDRLLSCFLYVKAGGRGFPHDLEAQAALADCDDFEHFATRIGEYQERLRGVRALSVALPHYPHLLPQTFWTHDLSGEPLLDVVGRFERLADDFAAIARRIGVDGRLPRVNTTEHGDYRAHYSTDAADAIGEAYADDVERFGYEFSSGP
jgi:hypothetical protein